MATITTSADGRKIKAVVAAGETTGPIYVNPSCTVAGTPGASCTVLAQATWSSEADVAAGLANWQNWDAGVSAAAASQKLPDATAIRVTAATAAAVVEVSR